MTTKIGSLNCKCRIHNSTPHIRVAIRSVHSHTFRKDPMQFSIYFIPTYPCLIHDDTTAHHRCVYTLLWFSFRSIHKISIRSISSPKYKIEKILPTVTQFLRCPLILQTSSGKFQRLSLRTRQNSGSLPWRRMVRLLFTVCKGIPLQRCCWWPSLSLISSKFCRASRFFFTMEPSRMDPCTQLPPDGNCDGYRGCRCCPISWQDQGLGSKMSSICVEGPLHSHPFPSRKRGRFDCAIPQDSFPLSREGEAHIAHRVQRRTGSN